MTPEVEAALQPLNWERVTRQYPAKAGDIARRLEPNGGLLYPTAQTARVALNRHRTVLRAMETMLTYIADMNPAQIARINLSSSIADLHSNPDFDFSGRVDNVKSALTGIILGMLRETELMEWEAKKTKRGGRKNEAAYRVAEAVAEIYVLGRKQRPTLGKLADGTGVSGLFGKVVVQVLLALGVEAQPYGPCDAAKSAMTDERMQELLKPEPTRRARSLFSIYPSDSKKN